MSVRMPRSVLALTVLLLMMAGCRGNSSRAATARLGDEAKADRTVEITMSDDLKFEPATVSVKRGETVAYKVVNPSKIDHEFTVGDAAFQEAHDTEMKTRPSGITMANEAMSIALPPGQTKTITFTFPTSGRLVYGCHEPGHYSAGMKGEIKVT